MSKTTQGTTDKKKKYVRPNTLSDLWRKWGKAEMGKTCRNKKLRVRGQEEIFTKVAMTMWDEVLNAVINEGVDVTIPNFGSIEARQIKHHDFRANKYRRNFEFMGGREYTIHDLMRKGNKYPAVRLNANQGTVSRRVYWRIYLSLKHKWRHRLYEAFYDEGMEYKPLRYLTEAEWKKRNENKKIWRSGMILKVD